MILKQWNNLKPATKRVKIAQDVIKRIKNRQYEAKTGVWAVLVGLNNVSKKTPLQPIILGGLKCECCALGGLMISRIALANEANGDCLHPTPDDYYYSEGTDKINYDSGSRNGQTSKLHQIFDKKQLKLIEAAYELGRGAFRDDDAEDFGGQYYNNTERLISIMENIIKNKGTFIP